ncbi:MAG: circadian clock protein KaiC [Rhodobiaceae bacterium]|nr:circadian clock protein KaiC [Rhodobiaceae bacterium]MCC0012952.1 circadian clock protein KaiC [Rhodobiaceae bacterium]MCC0051311.1 circadian clock protein KaiC [Rhodobiaceae bacterium]MCC0061563.1 circadian clock protein KaiC [Rhodobiaceae bacterium]
MATERKEIEKLPTGIPGFDQITTGGLPKNRTTVVAGTAGSGKTVLALQFLFAGVHEYGQAGVFVTFEESPADLMQNVRSFGWDLEDLVSQKKIAVVDASPEPGEEAIQSGTFDLSALLARIENAVSSVKAKRVILDAVGALFPQFTDSNIVRRELHRIAAGLRRLGVTTIITLERTDEEGGVGRFGVEEFVADNVLILRNRLEQEKRRRTIEILKFRGAVHQKGEYPFTVDSEAGVTIIPLSAIELKQRSSIIRVPSGVPELDKMCGGGMYRDSIILVSGATGAGKTLTVTHYVKAAIDAGQRALLFGAEESREQLTRNAASWGVDFEKAEREGLLRIVCRYPEIMGLEDHLLRMRRDIDEFKPSRIAVDSMSAYERAGSRKSFREFVIGLTSHIKHLEITGLITNTTPMLMGGESITETHISTITDTIILLRYVELHGEMRRGLAILKMRGTQHEKDIREYVIDSEGMHIKAPFRGIHGILTGTPTYMFTRERDNLADMFSPRPEQG